jgi:TM2 domain-containing membrane protein YozV
MTRSRFVVCLFLLAASVILAQQDKTQWDFSSSLFDQKEYYRAVSEFERFIYFFPSSPSVPKARFQIALSYYKAEQYTMVPGACASLSNSREWSFRAGLLAADSRFKLNRFPSAYNAYEKIEASASEKDRAVIIYRKTWPLLLQKDFKSVLGYYDTLLSGSADFDRKGDIPYLKTTVTELTRFRPLSPVFAGILSAVIPGAGQFYVKRPGDGVVSFLVTGVLVAGSYLLWQYYDHKSIAVLTTAAAAFFYAGNIYSAWSQAHKYNNLYYSKNLDALRASLWQDYDFSR